MLGVIAAMQNEADVVLKHCTAVRRAQLFGRTVWHAELYNKDILLVLSGVGKTNAAASAMLALSQGADKLLNVGVAGGLAPQAKIGSVVRIARAVQSDFDLSVINGTSVGTLNEYETPYLPAADVKGARYAACTLASADHFGCGTDREIEQALGAQVRDMEGAAIAHVADRAGVPWAMYKAISDNAGEDSPREYAENLALALDALSEALENILEEVCNG